MRIVGADLAAEAANTAVAALDWRPGEARPARLTLGATDEAIVEAILPATTAGIDCPLG